MFQRYSIVYTYFNFSYIMHSLYKSFRKSKYKYFINHWITFLRELMHCSHIYKQPYANKRQLIIWIKTREVISSGDFLFFFCFYSFLHHKSLKKNFLKMLTTILWLSLPPILCLKKKAWALLTNKKEHKLCISIIDF